MTETTPRRHESCQWFGHGIPNEQHRQATSNARALIPRSGWLAVAMEIRA